MFVHVDPELRQPRVFVVPARQKVCVGDIVLRALCPSMYAECVDSINSERACTYAVNMCMPLPYRLPLLLIMMMHL